MANNYDPNYLNYLVNQLSNGSRDILQIQQDYNAQQAANVLGGLAQANQNIDPRSLEQQMVWERLLQAGAEAQARPNPSGSDTQQQVADVPAPTPSVPIADPANNPQLQQGLAIGEMSTRSPDEQRAFAKEQGLDPKRTFGIDRFSSKEQKQRRSGLLNSFSEGPYKNTSTSIVDLMKSVGLEDTSYAARKQMAINMGIPKGLLKSSAKMNQWLHDKITNGISAGEDIEDIVSPFRLSPDAVQSIVSPRKNQSVIFDDTMKEGWV